MANNASPGRFYPFTTNTSAPLPPSAASPDPQYRRHSSGSDSVSDDDRGALAHSYPVERAPQGQGVFREPFGAQNVSGFVQNRADPASATIYVDDSPYVPSGHFRASQPSNFIQPGPDVSFAPAYNNFSPAMPPPMTPTPPHVTPYGHHSGDSSPTGSNGSGGSGGSGRMSGSSGESATTGVVGYESPGRDHFYHNQQAFGQSQRVGHPPGFNPEYYPAYDEHRQRIGMEHARFGMDPRQPEHAYYRPRTLTYPPVGAHGMAPEMGSPEHMQTSNFPSPELPIIPMHPGDFHYGRDARNDHVIPGQTRIHLPPANAPRHHDPSYVADPPSVLRSGDDACYQLDEDEVRHQLGLSPDQELSLNALADPPPGQRPGQSIPILSQLAILGSPNKRLTLQEIYHALEDRFEWFRMNRHDKSWQNSIRHNLSLYKCFRRIAKPITEPGKGSYWVVDYRDGAGTKRPRKRNKRTKEDGSQKERSQEDRDESDPDPMDSDESFHSPAQLVQDIDAQAHAQAQSHQVGQSRTRLPPASAARSVARRGNSPYSQNVQASSHGRQTRQSAQAQMNNQANAYGGQPAFGQPSMGLPGFSQASFEQPGIPNRSQHGGWLPGPGQPMQAQSLQFLPPPDSFDMGMSRTRLQQPRSNTLPANIAHELRNSQYTHAPPRQGFEQARDASGRFLPRGAAQQQASGGHAQHFVQGSSRGGRRTSSSSESSRE